MLRRLSLLVVLSLVFAVSALHAQAPAKKGGGGKPSAKDPSIGVTVFMRDGQKNELLLATRIWPGYPDYNALALQRFFATMKALEPEYKQDDEVAYSWGNKGKVAKCSIYLESADADAKTGTGAVVGCEANGVSGLAVVSSDGKRISGSDDPKHIADVIDMFKKQSERAKHSLGPAKK